MDVVEPDYHLSGVGWDGVVCGGVVGGQIGSVVRGWGSGCHNKKSDKVN